MNQFKGFFINQTLTKLYATENLKFVFAVVVVVVFQVTFSLALLCSCYGSLRNGAN